MKKINPMLFILVGGIFAGSIIGRLNLINSPKQNIINSSLLIRTTNPINEQNPKSRTWKAVSIDKVLSINNYGNNKILMPGKIEIRYGYIYVFDFNIPAVLKYSLSGNFQQKFGNGKGRGPGEFQSPTDFDVLNNGHVFVTDGTNNMISLFDSKGRLLRSIKTNGAPVRIAAFNDSQYFVRLSGIGNLFYKFNNNKPVKSFGLFTKEQSSYSWPEDISLTCNDGKTVYGAFFHGGYIVCYDAEGNQLYFVQTIDRFSFPKLNLEHFSEGTKHLTYTSISRSTPVSAIDISCSNDTLFVFAGQASKEAKGVVIDAYSSKDGKYIYSFKFSKPQEVEGYTYCTVSDGYLYLSEILKDGNADVSKYKIVF